MASHRMFGRSQIDASDAFHDFSCSPCSEDGKNTEALYHCIICQAFYCQTCVNFHNKFTKNHSVTDRTSDAFGQEFGKSATKSSKVLPTDVCEEHHGEEVKMYCGHHDLVCCTVCIAVKHRSCEGVEYIPNIASKLLKEQGKEKTKLSLEKVKADLKDLKSKTENDLRHLDKQRDGFIDDVQDFKKRIIARVEELERKSLKEVRSKHKELADNINAYSKKIDGLLRVIDVRLHKLTHSKDVNEAQNFVDVKRGEKELLEGTDLAKQTTLRKLKVMKSEINIAIEEYLSKERSLGSVKEYSDSVNIVCPLEDTLTSKFISELQSQLQSYDIWSEYTKASEIVESRYTIILSEYGYTRKAMERTTGIQGNTIILMRLRDTIRLYARSSCTHGRKIKADFTIDYDTYSEELSFSFASIKGTYKSISDIVMGRN
ncbi:probable E3 ubiquitin-protein ligase MID2 [Mercenaria mercenaria]|uniref:probable E3 ubiquitin-protein ligase MID2 n=1 Tax=Mercenaria mercenaria TaxID=6596 RepID=UPI00234EA4E6|nr:probable E3 ubiquitin-protein ligase MID2 [Mercenaria mercenaria]